MTQGTTERAAFSNLQRFGSSRFARREGRSNRTKKLDAHRRAHHRPRLSAWAVGLLVDGLACVVTVAVMLLVAAGRFHGSRTCRASAAGTDAVRRVGLSRGRRASRTEGNSRVRVSVDPRQADP